MAHAAPLALGLGTEGLPDVGTEGSDHVKAVRFVKDQRAVKVEKNGVDGVFCSHTFDVSGLMLMACLPLGQGRECGHCSTG